MKWEYRTTPIKRYLIGKETSIGWGGNCVRFGNSCKYFSDAVLGAENIRLNEISEIGESSFDLVGCFNIMDHHLNPMDIIKDLLNVSRNVLLVTHKPEYAGKQHLFALGDQFVGYLEKNLPDIKVENLNPFLERDDSFNNYILLRKI